MLRLFYGAFALCVVLPAATNNAHAIRAGAASPTIQVFVQPGAGLAPITSLIQQAHHSLRLEVYLLTDRSIVRELGRARQRGVDVRVLLEQHPFGGGRYAALGYKALQDAQVPVRWANGSAFQFTHEKAMEIDGTESGIFTLNLTSSGLYKNREFGVLDFSATDARALAQIFEADWARSTARVSDAALAISPTTARSKIDTLFDGAVRSLDLYAEEVNDVAIEAHLSRAVKRGVHVRLITSQSSAGVDVLRRSGIRVAVMSNPYVHAKAVIADRARIFIGSENLSTTSLDRNREVGILADNSTVATQIERVFAADWSANAGSAPPPGHPSTGPLRVRVSASPPSVSRGQTLTISASTNPGAVCTVRVTYPDGYVSRARSLSRSETAGASGTVSWSWHVGTKVPGVSKADVTCIFGSTSAYGSTTFEVR